MIHITICQQSLTTNPTPLLTKTVLYYFCSSDVQNNQVCTLVEEQVLFSATEYKYAYNDYLFLIGFLVVLLLFSFLFLSCKKCSMNDQKQNKIAKRVKMRNIIVDEQSVENENDEGNKK